jgi:hypothetical protein
LRIPELASLCCNVVFNYRRRTADGNGSVGAGLV